MNDFKLLAKITPNWTENLTDIGTSRFDKTYPGEASGRKIFYMEIIASWAGITGGDGGSLIRFACNTYSTPDDIANGSGTFLRIGGRIDPNVDFSVTGCNVLTGVTTPGRVYGTFAVAPYSSATGSAVPFPPYFALRLSNPTTGYTAGTVTLEQINCYG